MYHMSYTVFSLFNPLEHQIDLVIVLILEWYIFYLWVHIVIIYKTFIGHSLIL